MAIMMGFRSKRRDTIGKLATDLQNGLERWKFNFIMVKCWYLSTANMIEVAACTIKTRMMRERETSEYALEYLDLWKQESRDIATPNLLTLSFPNLSCLRSLKQGIQYWGHLNNFFILERATHNLDSWRLVCEQTRIICYRQKIRNQVARGHLA